jgi:hypothetical protein
MLFLAIRTLSSALSKDAPSFANPLLRELSPERTSRSAARHRFVPRQGFGA